MKKESLRVSYFFAFIVTLLVFVMLDAFVTNMFFEFIHLNKQEEHTVSMRNYCSNVVIDPRIEYEPFLHPFDLQIGKRYRLESEVPIAKDIRFDGLSLDISGGSSCHFGIIEILDKKDASVTPWYHVNLLDDSENKIIEGWVNGLTLLGQRLIVLE